MSFFCKFFCFLNFTAFITYCQTKKLERPCYTLIILLIIFFFFFLNDIYEHVDYLCLKMFKNENKNKKKKLLNKTNVQTRIMFLTLRLISRSVSFYIEPTARNCVLLNAGYSMYMCLVNITKKKNEFFVFIFDKKKKTRDGLVGTTLINAIAFRLWTFALGTRGNITINKWLRKVVLN